MEETVLVFSDTHGNASLMKQALDANPTADIIHLGDGIDDLSFLNTEGRKVYSVWGNFEGWMYPAPRGDGAYEKVIEISGTRILMMHGHLRSVKSSLYAATLAALEADADLLLYGHTHIPNDTYLPSGSSVGGAVLKKPLRIMNPGTSGKGCSPSYGVLTFRDGVLLTSHFKK
jgi:putative phosphoesterase